MVGPSIMELKRDWVGMGRGRPTNSKYVSMDGWRYRQVDPCSPHLGDMDNTFEEVLAHGTIGIPSDDCVEVMSNYFRKFVVNHVRKSSF